MLHIYHPVSRAPERAYILQELLGHIETSLTLHAEDRADTIITLGEGKRLVVDDGLLGIPEARWLTAESMPGMPRLLEWPAEFDTDGRVESRLPVLQTFADEALSYSTASALTWDNENSALHLHADIFGSAFFFLTRYEEVASNQSDQFDRFPADAAYAQRYGFLDRPVVDEYRAILEFCIHKLWPELPVRSSKFKLEVSHDVDLPLRHAWAGLPRMLGAGLRDLVRGGSVTQLRERASSWYAVRHRQQYERDPYNTFDALMAQSERRGLRSAFYFIADRPAGNIDALYTLEDPFIEALIGRLHRAGHEIGLHPSYNTYLDPLRTRAEFERLLRVCDRQQVKQQQWGGRQHFLRWRAPQTWRNWDAAGIDYDSTLGYAQQVGFRCGTSHEFHPFDLQRRQTLRLIERPLVVMDATLLNYLGLGFGHAPRDLCRRLKDRCRVHGGVFALLWHNSNLTTPEQWRLYLDILDN